MPKRLINVRLCKGQKAPKFSTQLTGKGKSRMKE